MPVVQRASIDPAARDLLRPHLRPGEALVWAGFPAKGRFGRGAWPLFLFGIPWTAFVLFWEGGVLLTGHGVERVFMALFGLPFVAIGYFLLSAPFRAMGAGKGLVYGATDERLLVVQARGKAPDARSYGPGDLAEVLVQDDRDGMVDVLFAVDANVAGLMPIASGKTAGSLDKIGFMGVPKAAADAARAVRARRKPGSPSGPLALPVAEAQAAPKLEARGTLEACRVKLAGLLTEQAAARARKHATWQNRFWLIAAPAVVAPPVIGFASDGLMGGLIGLFVSAFVAGVVAIARWIMNAALARADADAARFTALQDLLAGWQQDAHPKARFHAAVDLGPATGVRPYRFANSASSGALKTWHRHRWARFVWATACGTPIVIELVDKVKYKGGAEVERHPHVRGWIVPNPAVWDPAALDRALPGLALTTIEVDGRTAIGFRAQLATSQAASHPLAQLFRALRDARPAGTPARSVPPAPDAG